MASITTRAGKGSPLTNAEVDANFTALNTELGQKLVASSNLSDLANAATARTNLDLGNVENKSSATIRSELTSSNVTTALGFTPLNRAADTMIGLLGLGNTSSPLAYADIRGNKGPTNGTTLDGFSSAFTASDVTTTNATSFTSFIGPGSGVALTNLTHYAAAQRTFSGTASVQTGFEAAASLTGATTNYGFRGRIAAGTGRWNLYMDGTAANFLGGDLTVNGNTTLGDATSDTITATGRFNTDLVPSTGNARDLGTSALNWKQVYATTFTENGFGVVSQTDIGTAPNEIPLNQYLGPLAYLMRPYRKVQRQLATAGQTVFTITGGYALGFIDVYLNGVKLYSNDFTETNTNTITLAAGAALNDEVEFVVSWVES